MSIRISEEHLATHTDKSHTHSHFVVNSVSCENGYKYHSDNENIERLRAADLPTAPTANGQWYCTEQAR